MPRRILEFPSAAAANAQQNIIHNWMQANVTNYQADRWDDSYKHPTRNAWRVTVKPRSLPSLPPQAQAQVKDQEPDWEIPL